MLPDEICEELERMESAGDYPLVAFWLRHVTRETAEQREKARDRQRAYRERRAGSGGKVNGTKPPKRERPAPPDPRISEVISHYQTHKPRARPGKKEVDKIRERLREGYSADDLKAAIDGCFRSPFHCGENENNRKYQSLELIVRDSKHVLDFIETPDETGHVPLKAQQLRRNIELVKQKYREQYEAEHGPK